MGPENPLSRGDSSHSPVDKMSMDLVPQNLLDRDADDILLCDDVKPQDSDLSAEERIFLEEFPNLKGELDVDIQKLHALAHHIDTTHKTLTKTSVVANSITVVSRAMSILGLVLAPATAGGSLVLSTAGRVLGTAGEVTSILTNVLERFHSQEAQAQVGSLMPFRGRKVRQAGTDYIMAAGKVIQNCRSTIEDVQKSIRAFQITKAHPHLATAAKRLLTTGQVSAQRSRQVQRAFEGTTLVMKTKARLLGSAMAGFSLSVDLASLLKDWKQLKEGARTELAEGLRAQAQELERQLTQLTQCYESLQQRKLLQEKKPVSSSEGTMGTVPLPPATCGEAGSQVTGEDEGN
ncbi:apolipoprotein L6 [Budorcas taxicolor]|uniref:apolipoprotein L6 n=1 Tax=Budorcas taxicolor TaxID=37181 RepID=UPI00228373E3|nr:apolipoprotein L6 [Budorcas taxicolor]